MKQIYLGLQDSSESVTSAPCFAKFVVVWALYGYGMVMLWHWAGGAPGAQALVWAIALLLGLALLVATREVWTWNG